jgi:peptidyl-prolyl cis-trans isomerase A (cyclophilin A)
VIRARRQSSGAGLPLRQQNSLDSAVVRVNLTSAALVFVLLCAATGRAQETRSPDPVSGADAAPATTEPSQPAPEPPAVVPVLLQTSLGVVRIAVEVERAPVTAANFLRYVDNQRFDGITWYRALKLDADGRYGLVQAGLRGDRKRLFKPIAHEAPAVTGLSHTDGAVSMARLAPGSATADFFVVIGDLVSLDGKPDSDDPGYAVFARVTEGMDIIRQMLDLPRDPNAGDAAMRGQMLVAPVRILTARRAESPSAASQK